jgi:hypothetical protein
VALRVDPQKSLGAIASDFIGLGYEISSVARPGLLSAENVSYVQFVKTLGAKGVIRVGGNTSDYARYSQNATAVSSPKDTVVNNACIRDLAGFLESTGWRLIWGLNLGRGTKENAIAEAQSVMNAAKDKWLAFEIGNEPDLFGKVHRPPGYGYQQYLQEYREWKTSLRQAIPGIPLAGPDAAVRTDWVTQFASDEARDLKLLTHHYYAEGPPQNPASTIERLLQTDDKLTRILQQCEAASRQAKIRYRICETNSCFGGGKPGVSDTLASALWGLDFLFTLADADAQGVNLETGVNQLGFISSYSPIGDDEHGNYEAKPLYYAMLAFAQASRGDKVRVEYDASGINLKAYAVKGEDGPVFVTMINKEPAADVILSIEIPSATSEASLIRLRGPALEAKAGVTLAGESVTSGGEWKPEHREKVSIEQGNYKVQLPAASAAILTVGP